MLLGKLLNDHPNHNVFSHCPPSAEVVGHFNNSNIAFKVMLIYTQCHHRVMQCAAGLVEQHDDAEYEFCFIKALTDILNRLIQKKKYK